MVASEPETAVQSPAVAYFSMEVGLTSAMPTYSGGLGVVAGDTLRAAADLGLPMAAVTLVHHKGYFDQHLDAGGNQTESASIWSPEAFLEPLPARVSVTIEARRVRVRAWRYLVRGLSAYSIPVYFLDTALAENDPFDQTLTDYLYGGDERYRLCQETLLGLGGVAMLRALRHSGVQLYHMNEGHSALLVLALLEEQTKGRDLHDITEADMQAVRESCVFTTHTPVAAGQDQFSPDLVRQVLGEKWVMALQAAGCCPTGTLNMTYLGLFFSHYINGVSMRHEEISQNMFPGYPINSISNGVHAVTWTAPAFQSLYDRLIPEWRGDNLYLRYAIGIPLDEIQKAHAQSKRELLAEVEKRTGVRLHPAAMTLGFARRASAYKRADLLLTDIERLKSIASQVSPLQVVYAGKSHPRDESGKAIIRRIFEAAAALGDAVPVVYLEDHDMELAKCLCAGVDLWLNTPQKPQEASGTSGMKAALNGVPSLSVLDGWWIEGHTEGVTGWSIGDGWEAESDPSREIASLYDKLEFVIVPMFYGRPEEYATVMRSAIALNGSFFNAQRMMLQYLTNAYRALG
jgi:starch phosphorylase